MSRKIRDSYDTIILLPDELGVLIHFLRVAHTCKPGSEAWANAVGIVYDAATVAFAHAVASKSDTMLLMLASPVFCKAQRRGDKGPQ